MLPRQKRNMPFDQQLDAFVQFFVDRDPDIREKILAAQKAALEAQEPVADKKSLYLSITPDDVIDEKDIPDELEVVNLSTWAGNQRYKDSEKATSRVQVKTVKLNAFQEIFAAIEIYQNTDIAIDMFSALYALKKTLDGIKPIELAGTEGVKAFVQSFTFSAFQNTAQTKFAQLKAVCDKRIDECNALLNIPDEISGLVADMEKKLKKHPDRIMEYEEKIKILNQIKNAISPLTDKGQSMEGLFNHKHLEILIRGIDILVERSSYIKHTKEKGKIAITGTGDVASYLRKLKNALEKEIQEHPAVASGPRQASAYTPNKPAK